MKIIQTHKNPENPQKYISLFGMEINKLVSLSHSLLHLLAVKPMYDPTYLHLNC